MNLIMMTRPLRARIWPGYLLAVALSVAALWIRFEIGVTLSDSPYLTFVVAVLLASFLGGFGPGLLALVLSGLLAKYYLIEPVGGFALTWPAGWIGMILYLFTAGTIVLLMRAVLNAHEAQMRSEAEVHALNADLEAQGRRAHRLARGGNAAAQRGAGADPPDAEDGIDRPADRRHRARFQQYARDRDRIARHGAAAADRQRASQGRSAASTMPARAPSARRC